MWFQVELPKPMTIAEIQFESGPPGGRSGRAGGGRAGAGAGGRGGGRAGPPPFGSFPIGYQVQVSMDGTNWGAPVAEGAGALTPTIVAMKPVQAKFIRVTQTGRADDAVPWSVLNFRVYVQ